MDLKKLMAKMARSMSQSDDLKNQVESILEMLGSFIDISRICLFVENTEDLVAVNTFEWCNSGIQSRIDTLEKISHEDFLFCKKLLMADERIDADNIAQLPENLIRILHPNDTLSVVVFPFYISGNIQGFIRFEECILQRRWKPDELNLLKTVSGMLSTVYDRHLFQKKLKTEKENFDSFFKTIEDLIIIGDMEGKILFVNNAVLNKLGYTLSELKNMNILDLHPPEKQDAAGDILHAMFRGELDSCPLELKRKDQSILPVETRVWFGIWDNKKCIFGLSKDLSAEQEALQKFTKLFENNPALMAVSTIFDGKFIDVNTAFVEKLGYSKEEVLGKSIAELSLFPEPGLFTDAAEDLKTTGQINNIELKVRCKNDAILDGLFSGEIIESQGKQYLLTVMVDISEQKRLQKQLENQKVRLSNIIEGTGLGTWEWNIQSGEIVINKRWADIIGYSLKELEPINITTWIEKTDPDDMPRIREALDAHFEGRSEYYNIEFMMKHKQGHRVWIHDRGKVIEWDSSGKPLKMFGTHYDITEKKLMEDKIRELSIRDPLTNIYNRRYLFQRFASDLEKYKRDREPFSVSVIDIDHFKRINDTLGHPAGDYIIKQFTDILSDNIRPYDLLGRYGGEEFLIIQYNSEREQTAGRIEGILEKIRDNEFHYQKKSIQFTFSCGICDTEEFNSDELTIEDMVQTADRRLYQAKSNGRNRVAYTD